MKPIAIVAIVLGAALTTAGVAVFTVGFIKAINNSAKVVENEHVLNDSFSNIDISLATADLEFKVSADGNKKVVCQESEKALHEVKIENSTLYITHTENKEKKNWYDYLFNFDLVRKKITVYLPSSSFVDLNIKSNTGDILIPHDYDFSKVTINVDTGVVNLSAETTKEVNIKATTGNINVSNINPKELNLTASTGNINIKDVNVTEKLTVKTSTGHMSTNNVKAHDLEFTSSTGDQTLTNTVITNHIKLTASTGDITFNDSDAETIEVKTSTGDVRGTLLTSKIFYVESKTGRVNVPKSTTGGLCEVKTDTGDVMLSIKA